MPLIIYRYIRVNWTPQVSIKKSISPEIESPTPRKDKQTGSGIIGGDRNIPISEQGKNFASVLFQPMPLIIYPYIRKDWTQPQTSIKEYPLELKVQL